MEVHFNMKRIGKKTMAAAAAICLLAQGAWAESLSFKGTVCASDETTVYAAIGGKVAEVNVQAGQHVSAGDVLATLETTKIYAGESGVISGVFGQPGDSA